jgi:putative transposase
MSVERRRQMIEPEHSQLSIVRQCELVSISRSGSTIDLRARRR